MPETRAAKLKAMKSTRNKHRRKNHIRKPARAGRRSIIGQNLATEQTKNSNSGKTAAIADEVSCTENAAKDHAANNPASRITSGRASNDLILTKGPSEGEANSAIEQPMNIIAGHSAALPPTNISVIMNSPTTATNDAAPPPSTGTVSSTVATPLPQIPIDVSQGVSTVNNDVPAVSVMQRPPKYASAARARNRDARRRGVIQVNGPGNFSALVIPIWTNV